MTNIRLDHTRQTIIITKGFSKKASVYGSKEYEEILSIKRDFPNYTIEERKTTTRKTSTPTNFIDMAFIEKYCTNKNDNEFLVAIEEWKKNNINLEGKAEEYCFFKVRKAFLDKYSELIPKKENEQTKHIEDNSVVDCRKAS